MAIVSIVAAARGQSAVTAYRPVPSLPLSAVFSVRVNGDPVPVTLYGSRSIVWFAASGSASIEVTVQPGLSSYGLYPKRRNFGPTVSGNQLRFTMPGPDRAVLRDLTTTSEQLLIFYDPPESNAPVPGTAGVFDAQAYGADPTFAADAYPALQRAINDASAWGPGAVVYLGAGRYKIEHFGLKMGSNVNLYLAPGSVLQVSPAAPCCFEFESLMHWMDGVGGSLTGRGVIYGGGAAWTGVFYPKSMVTENYTDLQIRDVMFLDGISTALRLTVHDGAVIDNVKILTVTPGRKDGIDLESTRNIVIQNSTILSTDDNIAIGAGTNPRGAVFAPYPPTEFISIRNNLFEETETGHMISIPPYKPSEYFRNITADSNDSMGVDSVFGLYPFGGTQLSNIAYTRTRIDGAVRGSPVDFRAIDCVQWGSANCGTAGLAPGSIVNVTVGTLALEGFGGIPSVFQVNPIGPGSFIDQIRFDGVTIAGRPVLSRQEMQLDYYSGAITNVTFTAGTTPANACDVNGDGQMNALDIQLAANQALGIAACTSDLNQDGQCTVVDLQRVVNASLGFACLAP